MGTVFNDANGAMATQFVKEFHIGFPVGYATRDQVVSYLGLSVLDRWVVPQVAIIDRKGNIVAQSAATGTPELQDEAYFAQLPGQMVKESGATHAKAAPAKTQPKAVRKSSPTRQEQLEIGRRVPTRRLLQRCDSLGDLLAVKAAVFDEDLVGVHSRHQHSCQIHPLAVALQRLRVGERPTRSPDRNGCRVRPEISVSGR